MPFQCRLIFQTFGLKRCGQICPLWDKDTSVLEPLGVNLGENTRPDGLTIVPYKNGKSLTWDCTCVDTFAKSHVYNTASTAGAAATDAEVLKRNKYTSLSQNYLLEPIAIENNRSVWLIYVQHHQ